MTAFDTLLTFFILAMACVSRANAYLVKENRLLKTQLATLKMAGSTQTSVYHHCDQCIFCRLMLRWHALVHFISPDLLIHGHRRLFKIIWRLISVKKKKGRPEITQEIISLIHQMAKENSTWGAPRIHGELLKMGFNISERTISRYMPKNKPIPGFIRKWRSFYELEKLGVAGMDFFTVPSILFRPLYCLFIISHETRKLIFFNVTFHPTALWVAGQLVKSFSQNSTIKYMVHDHGSQFTPLVIRTLNQLGIQSRKTDCRAPWQNGIAERWVGNCRRDLLDHVIVLNEFHLYALVSEYAGYYNNDRTHYALEKETPEGRPILLRESDDDQVISLPRVCGIHHKYVWKKSA